MSANKSQEIHTQQVNPVELSKGTVSGVWCEEEPDMAGESAPPAASLSARIAHCVTGRSH